MKRYYTCHALLLYILFILFGDYHNVYFNFIHHVIRSRNLGSVRHDDEESHDTRNSHRQLSSTHIAWDPKTVIQKSNVHLGSQDQRERSFTKPVIHTFWEPVPTLRNGEKGTGMTVGADQEMLLLWKQAWEDIGWDTRIISMEDAKNHPQFLEFYTLLQNVPLWGSQHKGVNRQYNQWCYIRWLAMAAIDSDGGWMSDYDVIPIRRIDHSFGPFKTYTVGVPCLMSGTQAEWSRMAWSILEDGLHHSNISGIELWSDMHAFANIQQREQYLIQSSVVGAERLLTGNNPWTQEKECSLLRIYDFIHFSHHSIRTGNIRKGERFRDRPNIAKRTLREYEAYCNKD